MVSLGFFSSLSLTISRTKSESTMLPVADALIPSPKYYPAWTNTSFSTYCYLSSYSIDFSVSHRNTSPKLPTAIILFLSLFLNTHSSPLSAIKLSFWNARLTNPFTKVSAKLSRADSGNFSLPLESSRCFLYTCFGDLTSETSRFLANKNYYSSMYLLCSMSFNLSSSASKT